MSSSSRAVVCIASTIERRSDWGWGRGWKGSGQIARFFRLLYEKVAAGNYLDGGKSRKIDQVCYSFFYRGGGGGIGEVVLLCFLLVVLAERKGRWGKVRSDNGRTRVRNVFVLFCFRGDRMTSRSV